MARRTGSQHGVPASVIEQRKASGLSHSDSLGKMAADDSIHKDMDVVDFVKTLGVEEVGFTYYYDPLGFLESHIDWDSPFACLPDGTKKKPCKWQKDVLTQLVRKPGDKRNIQVAVSSGNGVGKTTLIAWITLWALMTRPMVKIIVSGNTEHQVRKVTGVEINNWLSICANADQYNMRSSGIEHKDRGGQNRATFKTWNLAKLEAVAGEHADELFIFFDEASSIPRSVWNHVTGYMSTGLCTFCAFGNPTKPKGMFLDCLYSPVWTSYFVDGRDCPHVSRDFIANIKETYGTESDQWRIRVLGMPPIKASGQLISGDLLQKASYNKLPADKSYRQRIAPAIGIDVATGIDEDYSCVVVRYGPLIDEIHVLDLSLPRLRDEIALILQRHETNICACDSSGAGFGLPIMLKERGIDAICVHVSSAAIEDGKYLNRRMELYAAIAKWIDSDFATIGQGDNQQLLIQELRAMTYSYSETDKRGRQVLVKKKVVSDELGRSPDRADALAFTFAVPAGERGFRDESTITTTSLT